MPPEMDFELAGEPVRLLGDRALYRPQARSLLVADLHLGKGEVFRRAGIPVPTGGTQADLARLDHLLRTHSCRVLWILGDLLHGPAPRGHWEAAWRRLLEQHPQVQVKVLRGNHDRALPPMPGVELFEDEVLDGPFVLRHAPGVEDDRHVICGHLHPRVRVPGLDRRWPAFWLRARMTVLPAFSAFTGGVDPLLERGERLVACIDGEVLALPVHPY
jgi:DNA ligase-associated metallophosphoesterase